MSQESHSAQFGLDPHNNTEEGKLPEPGSTIKGEEYKAGKGESGGSGKTDDAGSKVGGVEQGSDDNARPGAGSSTLEPSQGSAKKGDES